MEEKVKALTEAAAAQAAAGKARYEALDQACIPFGLWAATLTRTLSMTLTLSLANTPTLTPTLTLTVSNSFAIKATSSVNPRSCFIELAEDLSKPVDDPFDPQDKRTGEAGYEARLQKAEEQVSSIAAAAEARSQAKMLAEVERYKARHVLLLCSCDPNQKPPLPNQ